MKNHQVITLFTYTFITDRKHNMWCTPVWLAPFVLTAIYVKLERKCVDMMQNEYFTETEVHM